MKALSPNYVILLALMSCTTFYANNKNEKPAKPLAQYGEADKKTLQEDATKFQHEATQWLLARQAELNKERALLQEQYPMLYPVGEAGASVGFVAGVLKRVAPKKIFSRAGSNVFHCGVRGAAMGVVCHLGIRFAQECQMWAQLKNSPAHALVKQQAPELVNKVEQQVDKIVDQSNTDVSKPEDQKPATINPILVTFLLAFAAA